MWTKNVHEGEDFAPGDLVWKMVKVSGSNECGESRREEMNPRSTVHVLGDDDIVNPGLVLARISKYFLT